MARGKGIAGRPPTEPPGPRARRRRGGLTEEEAALWQQVARTATPLHPGRPAEAAAKDDPAPPPPPARESFSDLMGAPPVPPGFRIGAAADPRRAHDLAPPLAERLGEAPPRMDGRNYRRMLRGKTAPEARIDLHGMTLAEAHPALVGFLLSAQARGLRLVLVITGKGKPPADDGPIPVRAGVLRHQVPHWLRLPPIGPLVLQVAPAHLRHGGTGAYYVYLRRLR